MFVLFNNRNKSARRPQTTMAGATGDDAERIPGHSAGWPPGNTLTCTHLSKYKHKLFATIYA